MRYQQPVPFALFEEIRLMDKVADIGADLRFGYRARDARRPCHVVFDANRAQRDNFRRLANFIGVPTVTPAIRRITLSVE